MKMGYKIDGIRMKLQNVDIDGDGITDEVESVKSHRDSGVISIKDTTELGEALEHQNKDVENENRLSSVDFISRINSFQLGALVAVDTIASMHVISKDSRLVIKNLMRKAVSIDGKGRDEFVQVVTGKKENDIRKASASNLIGNQPKQ